MDIRLTFDDDSPRYEQIVRQVKYLVATGRLIPGEELPSIRALAEQLLITPNTVARAYRELENEGIVVKRQTTGTFISERSTELALRVQRGILTERIDQLLEEAQRMNIDVKEIINLVQMRAQEYETDDSEQ